ncbi:MAG: hypothetical protein RLZZ252_1026 [Bacteroidota bacterium]|jgi:hypothetical protein
MNLMNNPAVLIGIGAVFLGGMIYVRSLTEKALTILTAEEKGIWIDGMRESRKKLFYVVIALVAIYMLLVILGGKTSWYAELESVIFISYFGLLVVTMLWTHFKSMQFLSQNGFSEEVIILIKRSFWIKVLSYVLPIALMAYSTGVFR